MAEEIKNNGSDEPVKDAADNSAQVSPQAQAKPVAQKVVPDFLAQAKQFGKETPKQAYGPTGPSSNAGLAQAGSTPSGDPTIVATNADGTPAQMQPGDQGINPAGYDELKAEAKLWVWTTDFLASRGLAFYSKEGKKDDFKCDAEEKSQLESALVEYFKTLPVTPKMPAWMALAVAAAMIFGAKAIAAHQMRQEATKKAKAAAKAKKDSPLVEDTITTRNVGQMQVVKSTPNKPKASKVPKRKVKPLYVPYDPAKPYWDQARNSQGKKVSNPVSNEENEKRKASNGQPCLNCNQNICAPGKNACSPHCAGKLKKKKA